MISGVDFSDLFFSSKMNDVTVLSIVTCFYTSRIKSEITLTCKMASGSSTSAFSDNTEVLDSDSNDYTAKVGKDSTIIQSKVTIISEKKKVKLCTKFTVPHGQHVFLAMKTAEAFLDKIQKLSG